jgi:hypothetical protein
MAWLAITSLSAARTGISGWTTILVFFALFLLVLWLLDDPGEDWPPYAWAAPFLALFTVDLLNAGGGRGWEILLIAYILIAISTWLTTGPWLSFMTWRRPMLAATAPVLLWLSMGIGGLAQRWLPELLLM